MGITLRPRKLLRGSLLGVLVVGMLLHAGDSADIYPAREAAAPYLYDLVEWHVKNSLSKWAHRAFRALPWNSTSSQEKRRQLLEYFSLAIEFSALKSDLDEPTAGGTTDHVEIIEAQLDGMRATRREIRNDVEETLEAAISTALAEEGLGLWGGLVLPPVDVRLIEPPKVVVTSPRDRIIRLHTVLVEPDLQVSEMEAIEETLYNMSNISALVLDIGGVATYPASVRNDQPLRWTLGTSAHEWLHQYFFFRPLGRNMFDSREMLSLNETVAGIAGGEIGDRALERLGVGLDTLPSDDDVAAPARSQAEGNAFDFNTEMQTTRRRVDELLAEGDVLGAEAYMEERRNHFEANGANVRKLNQAYFAFYGAYAENPASVSPIGGQLRQLRDLMPDLGTFIRTVSSISSYRQLVDLLDELTSQPGAQ